MRIRFTSILEKAHKRLREDLLPLSNHTVLIFSSKLLTLLVGKLAYNELCEKLQYENTVNSLKIIASVNGIKGYSSMRKSQLCEAIAMNIKNQ